MAIDSNVPIDVLSVLIVSILLLARLKTASIRAAKLDLFDALMLCCVSVLLVDICALLANGHSFPGARGLLWFLHTAHWLLIYLYCFLWLLFCDLGCFALPSRTRRRAPFYAILLLCCFAATLINPLTGWLFGLTEANAYARGGAYPLFLIPCWLYAGASLVIVLCGLLSSRDKAKRQRCLSLLIGMLPPLCGALMALLPSGVSWVFPMIALSLLLLYLDFQQRDIRVQRLASAKTAEAAALMNTELANSRMTIMLSQIQPHFLYNALCVIQDLCHGKAPEAEQATIAFSRFLRGNLDSLNANAPIPFSQELGHTRYYLKLERMRFGERLTVVYDIATDRFSLPAITLQPIVENAVRYGVTKRESGGTVRISSEETDTAYRVIVSDDGVGFDPYQKHEDGRTHIGIENVRQRLRDMCGGDLAITSTPNIGTTAVITIPKKVE